MTDCIKCDNKLVFYPKDEIANYVCFRCGFMATKKWFDSLTPEQIKGIQDSENETRKFWREQTGKREAEAIKKRVDEIGQKDEIAELLQKHKKVVSLNNYYE